MRKALFVLILFLLVSGCTSLKNTPQLSTKQITSNIIGCPPDEIIILNETTSNISGVYKSEWDAECRDKEYDCEYVRGSLPKCREMHLIKID